MRQFYVFGCIVKIESSSTSLNKALSKYSLGVLLKSNHLLQRSD